jgi:type IV pilus assembly protein PilO
MPAPPALDVMIASLARLPWYWQIGILVIVALFAVVACHQVYLGPAEEVMAMKQRQLDALRLDIQRGTAIAARLPQFQHEVAELEARLDELEAVLPEQKDVGELLRRIQTLATQSNLTITGFKPQAVATRDLHAEWPIGLKLDGTYHNLGRFFEKISRFSRIIHITELAIQGKARAAPDSTITAECTATTFVLLERSAGGSAR